ncbi:MAG: hypothetical protein ABL927_10225 [Bdellovibrionales bacterium]
MKSEKKNASKGTEAKGDKKTADLAKKAASEKTVEKSAKKAEAKKADISPEVKAAEKAEKAKKTAATKAEAKKQLKATNEAAAQNSRYRDLSGKIGEAKPQPYRMANVYSPDTVIEHPKFGIGYVTISMPDKIEVVFEDSNRYLVQGRK